MGPPLGAGLTTKGAYMMKTETERREPPTEPSPPGVEEDPRTRIDENGNGDDEDDDENSDEPDDGRNL